MFPEKDRTAHALGGFYRTLFSIAVPIILQNLLQTFINMMDTVMVGQLGSVEIAAVGLGNQVFFMLNMILFGVCSGGAIFVSQFWGARDLAGIRRTFGFMLALCAAVALAFSVGGIFFPDFLISLYTDDGAVIAEGAKYLKIASMSYLMMGVTFSCQMAFRSTEHVVLPMVTTALSFLLNICFNYLFIFGFGPLGIRAMGASGAAVGTLVARSVEFAVTLAVGKCLKYEAFGSFREMFSFGKRFALNFFKVALPVILSESFWGLGITVQNSIFSHASTDAFSAFSIMNTVSQLTWVVFIGMGSASSVILGKKIGAGDFEGARAFAGRFSWFFPLMGLLVGLLLVPISRALPLVFRVSPGIIAIAQSMLIVLMAMYPFRAFNMLFIVGICRSGGDTVFASLTDNGWMWALAIPLGFAATFAWDFPPWAVLLCLESEQVIKSAFGAWRVRSGKWLRRVIG